MNIEINDTLISAILAEATRRDTTPYNVVNDAIQIWTGIDDHVKDCLAHVSHTHKRAQAWYVNQSIKAYTYNITSSENERSKAKL